MSKIKPKISELKAIFDEGFAAFKPGKKCHLEDSYIDERKSDSFHDGFHTAKQQYGIELLSEFDKELNQLCKKHDVILDFQEGIGFIKTVGEGEDAEVYGHFQRNFPYFDEDEDV